jgi:hypothetical protein
MILTKTLQCHILEAYRGSRLPAHVYDIDDYDDDVITADDNNGKST